MPFRYGPYRPDTRDRLTTVAIEIILPVGKLPLMICSKQAVSYHVRFNFSRLNSRLPVLHSGNGIASTQATYSEGKVAWYPLLAHARTIPENFPPTSPNTDKLHIGCYAEK